ncbi:MAG: hypothetical protein SFT68_04635 [Rickettsiaceae bacterium]|nr:hypothetical protein [Rickettsiaceae bacterium]
MNEIPIYKLDQQNKLLSIAHIKALPSFCHIKFSINKITDNTIFLLQNIHLNKKIEVLDLSRNPIFFNEYLVELLALSLENSNIQTLNLSFCRLTDESLEAFARHAHNLSMDAINLRFNNLTNFSLYSIHKLLSDSKNLKHLDICFNKNLCSQIISNLTNINYNNWDLFCFNNEILKLNFTKFSNNDLYLVHILNKIRAQNPLLHVDIGSVGGASIYTLYLGHKESMRASQEDVSEISVTTTTTGSNICNTRNNSDEIFSSVTFSLIKPSNQVQNLDYQTNLSEILSSCQNFSSVAEIASPSEGTQTDDFGVVGEDVFGYLGTFI